MVRVTFVLVSYGGQEMITRCLRLLRTHVDQPYRVVIVDSASPDGTGDWLTANVTDTNTTVLRMAENLGFGAGCNLGIAHADTEFVCLLNADVEVTAGWLAPLLAFLDDNDQVAAVAPLMTNVDGSVQESGSLIGGDGWCRAWDDDATARIAREVDYASAACLVLRRAAVNEVGGFSPDYEIAYFEDVDLAMALRARGWQTWVLPTVSVRHIRHGSSSSGRAEELMRLNHATFCRRWPAELSRRPPTVGLEDRPHRRWLLRDHLAPYRVLLIDDRVPHFDRGSGDPRTLAVLDAWRAADPRARVTYFAYLPDRAEQYAPALRERGIEVVWGVTDPAAWSAERMGLYDVIVVFRPHNFERAGLPIGRAQPQAVRVYDSEALFHRRPEQFFMTAQDAEVRRRYAVEAHVLRGQEVAAFNWADVGVCVSEEEARWARHHAPGTAVHVANYPATVPDTVPGWSARSGIAFFGGFNSAPGTPNEHAVLELARDVLPPLRARHSDLVLTVVGADPSAAVRALAADHIHVLGRVADPRPVLETKLLHVVPMRYGAGVKAKFIDSMAAGLPFVTTPVGGEGLRLGWTTRHLIGRSSAELVDLCDRMLTDKSLWTDVQAALLDICREHFSAQRFGAEMSLVMADCGVPSSVG